MPPYGRLAGVIVTGPDEPRTWDVARALARAAGPLRAAGAELWGPAPAPIARIRGRHRVRLLVRAPKGVALQPALRAWAAAVPCPGRAGDDRRRPAELLSDRQRTQQGNRGPASLPARHSARKGDGGEPAGRVAQRPLPGGPAPPAAARADARAERLNRRDLPEQRRRRVQTKLTKINSLEIQRVYLEFRVRNGPISHFGPQAGARRVWPPPEIPRTRAPVGRGWKSPGETARDARPNPRGRHVRAAPDDPPAAGHPRHRALPGRRVEACRPRAGAEAQLEREPVRPVAEGARGVPRRGGEPAPLSEHRPRRPARRDRRGARPRPGAHRLRRRLGRDHRLPDPGLRRARGAR